MELSHMRALERGVEMLILMYQVQDRISVDGALGTVRYRGPVPNWEVDALGIEWDNPARGKHSGSIKGTRYFDVSLPGSASFIKSNSPRIDKQVSFMQAVRARYAGPVDESVVQVSIGRKVWQNYGLDKLNAISKHFHQLPSLMVENSCISHAGAVEILHAGSLDLSYNLLSKWAEVGHILRCMPDLSSVNLNGNRITDLGNADFGVLSSVSLSDTKISPADVARARFPRVKSLVLAGNSFSSFDVVLPKLEFLDLSMNSLESVPGVCVQELDVSHNEITHLARANAHVQALDLRNNPIASFSEVDKIPQLFPNLKALKIDPISVGGGEDFFTDVVCRVPGLLRLNGSELSAAEVQSCELFFISKVQAGELSISNSQTWASLLAKHGMHATAVPKEERVSSKLLSSITLHLSRGETTLKRAFLPSNTVLRLKGVASSLVSSPFWQLSLYFYLDNEQSSEKQHLDNDMLTLETAGLEHGSKVFIELVDQP